MNVRLPGLGGIEATRRITTHPDLAQVGVLILVEEEHDEDLFAALRAGASGLLSLDTEPAELLRAVRIVAGGGAQLSPSMTNHLIRASASQAHPPPADPELFEELTVREREIVILVASGLTNQEIAEQLVVSPATVKTHVTRSMVKLHIHDRAKLVAVAYQSGFADPLRDGAPAAKAHRRQGIDADRRV
jgi:DNA-binding NarL/FixJ family response regulator